VVVLSSNIQALIKVLGWSLVLQVCDKCTSACKELGGANSERFGLHQALCPVSTGADKLLFRVIEICVCVCAL
jgi:hypothetical protein